LENLVKDIGAGEIFWPLRVALCGEKKSPPPEQIADILGKKESLERLDFAIKKINDEK